MTICFRIAVFLIYFIMCTSAGSNLRQVGDADYLTVPVAHFLHHVRLEEVNERLNLIYSLQQKHRAQTLDELIALTDEYRSKLSDITSYDERIAELTVRKEEQYKQVKQQAELLTKARTKAAREVEKQWAARLIPL